MATYMELFGAKDDSDLQDKVAVAVVVAAESVRMADPPPTNQAQRMNWAKGAMADPKSEARRMLWAVLAVNKDAILTQILGASDEAIQTQVDAAVDLFAGS